MSRGGLHARATEAGFRDLGAARVGLPLVAYLRDRAGGSAPPHRLTVYIEGDGAAWRTRTRVSDNPTPRDPVALALAIRQPSGSSAYVGRPCQYVNLAGVFCPASFWTDGRYGREAVALVGRAVDLAMAAAGADEAVLVGFSGGGTLATLLAATRDDVVHLITVAAPLDIYGWTGFHGVSPLAASLDPLDYMAALSAVAQDHFEGGSDAVVPPRVNDRFFERSRTATVMRHRMAEFDHTCCWAEAWPSLYGRVVRRR